MSRATFTRLLVAEIRCLDCYAGFQPPSNRLTIDWNGKRSVPAAEVRETMDQCIQRAKQEGWQVSGHGLICDRCAKEQQLRKCKCGQRATSDFWRFCPGCGAELPLVEDAP